VTRINWWICSYVELHFVKLEWDVIVYTKPVTGLLRWRKFGQICVIDGLINYLKAHQRLSLICTSILAFNLKSIFLSEITWSIKFSLGDFSWLQLVECFLLMSCIRTLDSWLCRLLFTSICLHISYWKIMFTTHKHVHFFTILKMSSKQFNYRPVYK
jgi:hypothetical protein